MFAMGRATEYLVAKNALMYRNPEALPQKLKREEGYLQYKCTYEGDRATPKWVAPVQAQLAAALMTRAVRKRLLGKQSIPGG